MVEAAVAVLRLCKGCEGRFSNSGSEVRLQISRNGHFRDKISAMGLNSCLLLKSRNSPKRRCERFYLCCLNSPLFSVCAIQTGLLHPEQMWNTTVHSLLPVNSSHTNGLCGSDDDHIRSALLCRCSAAQQVYTLLFTSRLVGITVVILQPVSYSRNMLPSPEGLSAGSGRNRILPDNLWMLDGSVFAGKGEYCFSFRY